MTRTIACVGLLGSLLTPAAGGTALAQPALERLEEMIRPHGDEVPPIPGQQAPADGASVSGDSVPPRGKEVQGRGYLGVKVDDQGDGGRGVLILEELDRP